MLKEKNNLTCLIKGHRVFYVGGWSEETKTHKCCYRCKLSEITPSYRETLRKRATGELPPPKI